MNLRLDEVAKAVGGTLTGLGHLQANGYSIDTRTLNPGDLFFAVKGPRFDGHDFVRQAVEKKAVGAVVENEGVAASANFSVVRVQSTLQALQELARYVRRQWGGPIVGVTGSAGKTTTKEMIATVLGRKYTVLRSVGNFNNEFGLPLCLLRIERSQTLAVLEMGMSAKGEIRKLAEIAEPNEGVITNVNPVHLEFFDSIEGIAEAKAELLGGLVEPRVAYLNSDDPRVRALDRVRDLVGVQPAADEPERRVLRPNHGRIALEHLHVLVQVRADEPLQVGDRPFLPADVAVAVVEEQDHAAQARTASTPAVRRVKKLVLRIRVS